MSRLNTPTIETAPPAARPALEGARKSLGMVPNMFRVIANSPAALDGYLGLHAALSRGALDAKTRERIALAVADLNGCNYCLSAHTYLGKNVAKLDEAEIAANRSGASNDAKADVAVRLATAIVRQRGHIDDAALTAARAAGFGDAEIVEIVAHVALNTLTNYINEVAGTEIDFPAVSPALHAA